ncbi:MAG: hypothetical protein IT209_01085 [Armatimonadetes bacterium]|nr:hypothetical protein [Armatimonadota bacterium]
MPRFLAVHILERETSEDKTFEAQTSSVEEIERFEDMALEDPRVFGYRSVCGPSGQSLICILEATDEAAVAQWFADLGLRVTRVEHIERVKSEARVS